MEQEINLEKIGQEIINYTKVYEGTDKYSPVMMAIQFGYQLALKQIENEK